MGKLINRIPGSRLLISSFSGSALRTHVESLGKPRDVNIRSHALPGQLDIKRHSPSILYIQPFYTLQGKMKQQHHTQCKHKRKESLLISQSPESV